MKLKMYNNGKGWYVPCHNYRDENDKAYLNIYFAKCEEPQGTEAEIIVDEARHGCYKGKIQLSIFKYHTKKNDDNSMFGGNRADAGNNIIKPDDLPFY